MESPTDYIRRVLIKSKQYNNHPNYNDAVYEPVRFINNNRNATLYVESKYIDTCLLYTSDAADE